jgi:hypothetical protein
VTGWINRTRTKRKNNNRRDHHERQIEAARTPSQKIWAACGWLISEAQIAGRFDDALDAIITKVHEIREEDSNDRHNDYAA